jgi:uncharacterized protein YdeI (YjbR/CyaY-like superfamily)
MNSKVDRYISNNPRWEKEIVKLRETMLGCDLAEEMKWGSPTYTFNGSNIVLIHVFKEYSALLFFKGALLKDPAKVLIRQSENVQAARQMRFTDAKQIKPALIRTYVHEAIEVEKAGVKVPLKKVSQYPVPEEFRVKLDQSVRLQKAFETLTPGRQRGYLLHFAGAKQSATRSARVEKHIPRILEGKGLNDE